MDLDRLRRHMDELAVETWEKIIEGDRRGLRFREDSISESHLYELDRAHSKLHVRRYNQTEEHRVGADWEWWIGSRAASWFCVRIQAKRVEGRNYEQLDHAGELPGEYQFDTLIRTSQGERAYPYYVFFNGFPTGWPADAEWRVCPNDAPPGVCGHHRVEDFGCAIVPARLVKLHHDPADRYRRRAARYLPYAQPWSHLFDPFGISDDPAPKVKPGGVVAALHRRHHAMARAAAPGGNTDGIFFPDVDQESSGVELGDLPAYAQALLDGESDPSTGDDRPDAHLVIVTDVGGDDLPVDDPETPGPRTLRQRPLRG